MCYRTGRARRCGRLFWLGADRGLRRGRREGRRNCGLSGGSERGGSGKVSVEMRVDSMWFPREGFWYTYRVADQSITNTASW